LDSVALLLAAKYVSAPYGASGNRKPSSFPALFIIIWLPDIPPRSPTAGSILSSALSSLLKAVTVGDRDTLAVMIAEGADVNATNDGGQTLLILAIVSGREHLLRLLLDSGADPLQEDHTGLNAINWAERKGRTDVANFLANNQRSAPQPTVNDQNRSRQASSVEPLRATTTAEEKTRKYLAGLRQRFAENPHRVRARREQAEEQLERSPVVDRQTTSERMKREAETPLVDRQTTSERMKREAETPATPPQQPDPTQEMIEASSRRAITAGASTEPDTKPDASESISTQEVPRRSSGRKRCPQCNTIYDSELLTYCAYHIVPLVDADVPVAPAPATRSSSILIWALVLATFVVTVVGSLYVSSRLFRNLTATPSETTAAQPVATLKGIPVAKGHLAQKAVSLPAAEVPLKTVQQPSMVTVRVKIDRSGKVVAASSTSADKMLRNAAIEAAKKATFSVDKLGGRGADGLITYLFTP
jgi:hypothetical protein